MEGAIGSDSIAPVEFLRAVRFECKLPDCKAGYVAAVQSARAVNDTRSGRRPVDDQRPFLLEQTGFARKPVHVIEKNEDTELVLGGSQKPGERVGVNAY